MFKSIISFFVKAAPRFVGEMMKNPKNITKMFKRAGEKLAKSEFAKKTENFLGQKPGEFMKECARDAVKQSATSLMMSAMTGGVTKLFSGGGGKQYSFPNKTSGSVIAGGGKAPGIQTTNAAQYSNVKAFNQTSRALGAEANRQAKLRKQQKKVIDRYRKDIQRKNFSVAELTSLSARLEKELRQQKTALTTGLKSGKHQSEGLKAVQPAKKIKQPTRIPQEQQQLAAYTKEALEDMNSQMQENIKAVNENISKSIAAMNKKEEEIAQKMMSNLGNYNTVTYKKLADTVTKTEEVSFKKQQESAYYQTDMLADKLDSSHDYNSKQLEVLRGEVLGNTQTMYELDKQSRMIDENYRALEERKNNGFTLATLGALLTQTYQMVQSSLKTPDIINKNVNDAMRSVAFTAGEEVGKLIQILAEGFNGIRAFFRKLYASVADVPVVAPMVGGLVNALDWVNDRIFRGLLGVEDSVIGDVFGTPGTLADMEKDLIEKKYGDDHGDNSKLGSRVSSTNYAGALLSTGGKHSYNLEANHMADLFDTNWKVNGNKVEVMTNSGWTTTLKHDKRDDESEEDYKKRKLDEAIDKETTEGFYYSGDNIPSRDNEQQARERLNQAIREIEGATVKRSGQRGPKYMLDYTYDAIHATLKPSYPHSEPPAESKAKKHDGNKHKNCIEILTDGYFDSAWGAGAKTSLQLVGGLKMRLLKAFKQASAKGIKYQVSSIFRTPSIGYSYCSPHHLGIAVDVAIEGMAIAIPKCWTEAKSYDPNSHNTYWSVILTSDDLEELINRSQLKPGTSEADYDLFVQWGEWQKICSQNELSVGVFSYPIASTARKITDGTKRLDMVHIQVANTAQALTQSDQKNKEKVGKESMSDINAAASDKINKGIGLDYQYTYSDFERDLLGNTAGIKQEEEMTSGIIGPKRTRNFEYYYTDKDGNYLIDPYSDIGGKASVRQYRIDEEGKLVLRKRDEHEKKIKTDTGMLLLDKIRAKQLSPEEMRAIKEEIARWEGMDKSAQKKSGKQDEMKDVIYVYNTFNNTTVANTQSEMSTGNTSNIPQ